MPFGFIRLYSSAGVQFVHYTPIGNGGLESSKSNGCQNGTMVMSKVNIFKKRPNSSVYDCIRNDLYVLNSRSVCKHVYVHFLDYRKHWYSGLRGWGDNTLDINWDCWFPRIILRPAAALKSVDRGLPSVSRCFVVTEISDNILSYRILSIL